MLYSTRSGGYSLTEVALVLGITGLLTALATPLFLNYYQSSRLRAAAEQVASLLNQGRELGIRENAGSCVHIGTTSLQYFVGTSCAGSAWVGAGTDAAGNIALPDSISLTTTADPVFSYLGASTATNNVVITVRNAQDNRTLTVTVAASGRASIGP